MPQRRRVILVQCPTWAAEKPPLGIPYLLAHLRKHGHDCRAFDFNIELFHEIDPKHRDLWNEGAYKIWMDYHFFSILYPEYFPFAMDETREIFDLVNAKSALWADRILESDPGIVGFTAMANTTLFALATCRELKKRRPELPIVFGGPNCLRGTNERFFLQTGWVDAVIPGEGEETLRRLVVTLEEHDELRPIPGVLIRTPSGEIADGGEAELVRPLDSLAFPDFSDFYPEKYLYKFEELPMTLSRGCVAKCSFCIDWIFWEAMRFRSADNIVAEMNHHRTRYGANRFYFNDLIFNGNLRQVEGMCDQLVAQGSPFHWSGNARVRPMMKPELLRKLYHAGCRNIHYGLEHGSQRMLDLMHKSLKIEDYSTAMRNGHRAGIRFSVSLILGPPTETFWDYLQCMLFVARHRHCLKEVHVGSLLLMRGSPLWKDLDQYGIVLPEKLSFPPELAHCEGYTYPFLHNWETRDGKNTRDKRERNMLFFRKVVRWLGMEENQAGSELEEFYEAQLAQA